MKIKDKENFFLSLFPPLFFTAFNFGKFQGLKCMDPLLEMWLSSSRYALYIYLENNLESSGPQNNIKRI